MSNFKTRVQRLENTQALGSLTMIIHHSLAYLDYPDQDPDQPFSIMLNGIKYIYVEEGMPFEDLL